jgi:ubiquinone/menaquinone biosynthesis C-methylase UbiE
MTLDHSQPNKEDVKVFWNARPCGTQFTELEWGSKEFFDDVERTRRETQPFMADVIRFSRYSGKRVLEIGCGLGTDLMDFARAGAVATGVDLTPAGVDLVNKRFALYGLPGNAMVGDAEKLPFPDATFDVVYSFGVLHHTPDTQRAIHEVFRVLKPGGEAIIMLYHTSSIHVRVGTALYAVYRFLRGGGKGTAKEDWVRIYDGSGNPLGRSYTKQEVTAMFSRFERIAFEVCDPIRRRFPRWVNAVNQKFFASTWGFYLVIRAFRPQGR